CGADLLQHHGRIGDSAALEDVRERGAGVFGIQIDFARNKSLVREQSSAEIELALDRLVQLVFDMLRDDFAEDQLLGEVLRADHNVIAPPAAGGEQEDAG